MAERKAMRLASIQHSSHSQHALRFMYSARLYICDGCNEMGVGLRYRCIPCDFDLHESCARAPKSTSHFCHPEHHLVFRENPVSSHCVCDLCTDTVSGFVYECRGCNFDLHPSCAKLPATLQHALHPHHALQLRPCTYTEAPPARKCNLCGQACNPGAWIYSCKGSTLCDFYLHISCAKLPVDPMEEMRMQLISPLEVPCGHAPTATNSSGATPLTRATPHIPSTVTYSSRATSSTRAIPQPVSHLNALDTVSRVTGIVANIADIWSDVSQWN